ncbi:MAG: calcium-binding protein [Oscillatoriales cyanobacterium]|uniref:Calcium-binding protein n=1 Tax=Microcoleus anatoxicus PTRS2 TaxID=2705321 RepID=A0ABU8YTQ1_9CYAN|nr:MAG: calcium-binding protein [Oscillatoriales cyanobacterium]TAE07138.1 MAG: calcium-binding protein [Oscillatoriales cyanobacterium]TAF05739.1 MAG: calcium-binding protein [Oscillatoriales cyanobacterium]TAF66874.1 MAG: calcium-binding protein [Oscillatoriales cyanobacterium]
MTTLNNNANVRDLNDTGLGPDTIFAGGGADFIRTSTLGGSLIFGQADNDTIVSVGSKDTIYGGDNEDSIRSQATDALLFGDGGNDTIVAELSATIQGGAGDDVVQGTAEANVIYGNEGADILLGGSKGRDSLYGGKQNDSLGFFKAGGDNNLNLTLSGGSGGNQGSNYLRGDSGDDLVVGINIRDSLYGGKDKDTLQGVGSSSYMDGGEGDDSLYIKNGIQTQFNAFNGNNETLTAGVEKITLMGGAGNDTITGGYGQSGGGKNLFEGGDGNDRITVFATQDTALGGAGNDFIESTTTPPTFNPLPNPAGQTYVGSRSLLDGGAGDDTLKGGFASDTLLGGADNDSLSGIFSLASGGDGNDTINPNVTFGGTNPTSITLEGGLGNDSLIGNLSAGVISTITNIMNGGGGNDTIVFGTVRDTLVGDSAGNDFISYASTVDFTGRTTTNVINDDQGNNLIFGANGTDVITTGSGNDTLYGGPATLPSGAVATVDGDDTLNAGGGNDVLLGGFGNDYLIGGDGDDSLGGGPGADTLIGGSGNDSFYYNNFGEGVSIGGAPNFLPTGSNPDQIGDFVSGQDKLVFQQTGFSALNPFPDTNRLSSGSLLVLETGAYSSRFGPAGAATNQGFLFYQAEDGRLGYDPDGTAGPNPGVTLAILNNKPGLSATDITLI